MTHWRASLDSETEGTEHSSKGSRPISPSAMRSAASDLSSNRSRSGTMSSSQMSTRTTKIMKRDRSMTPRAPGSPGTADKVPPEDPLSPTVPSPTNTLSPSTISHVATSSSITATMTEDSDTDFQSAYSTSPRESYYDSEPGATDDKMLNAKHGVIKQDASLSKPSFTEKPRERVSSAATAIAKIPNGRAYELDSEVRN